MMNVKHTLPFVLILGMTAGSTAAYAQTLDTGTTGAPATICPEGDADCVAAQDATGGATLDADVGAGLATDTETPAADLDGAVSAEADGSLSPLGADTSTAAATEDGVLLNGIHSLASTEDLVGVNVYDANDERVGEISAVIPADAENAEERVVIGMGGFLGFGQTPVAIPASSLQVAMDVDGEIERVVTTHTQAELAAMPEVEM